MRLVHSMSSGSRTRCRVAFRDEADLFQRPGSMSVGGNVACCKTVWAPGARGQKSRCRVGCSPHENIFKGSAMRKRDVVREVY